MTNIDNVVYNSNIFIKYLRGVCIMKEETKREKFVRLAENRVNNVLKGIDLLSNLSNSSNYDYTQEDLDKIVKSLKTAVSDLEKSYSSTSKSKKFKL